MKRLIVRTVLALGIMGSVVFNYSTSGEKNKYIKKEHVHDNLKLKVVIFKDVKALRKAIKKKFPNEYKVKQLIGYSAWYYPHDGTCVIYVLEPTKDDDIQTWGHELAHCVYGNWHDE